MRKIGLLLLCFLLAFFRSASALSKSEIVDVQQRLITLGYEIGEADGLIGSKTTAALMVVQSLLTADGHTVPSDGTLDAETLRLLRDENNDFLLRTLTLHSRGSRVRAVQERLILLGYMHSAADGIYGPATQSAVLQFEEWAKAQQMDNVITDGQLNPAEAERLLGNLSAYGVETPQDYDEQTPQMLKQGNLYAKAAILIDAVSGEVLFEKNADLQLEPASTTKIVTLLTALRHGNLDKRVTVPKSAARIPEDSSVVPVTPGEKMTMRDLLYGLMIRSGNDAANAVAELCSGSISDFVAEMNETAASIGMQNTHFANPHGYHNEEHYTTARDLAIAARYGLTDPEFCKIATSLQYTLPETTQRKALDIFLTHEIFNRESEYYIPYAAGVKSGFTSYAGFCYVGAYQRSNLTLIAVVLQEPERANAWQDLKKLFAYGECGKIQ